MTDLSARLSTEDLQNLERVCRKGHGDPSAMQAFERAFTFNVTLELLRLASIGAEVESRKGQVRRAWELAAELHLLLEKQP